MDFEHIELFIEGKTAVVTIKRPEVYNALTSQAKFEVLRCLRVCEKNEGLNTFIITGEGKAFCTGQDLNDRDVNNGEGKLDIGKVLQEEWNPLTSGLVNSRLITIAAVNGVCAGAGLAVAMSCDIVISKPDVKFVAGFGKIGLCPDAGSSYTFTRALGKKRALEFFIFNEPLLAQELHGYHLINKLVDDPLAEAKAWGDKIAHMAPLSLEITKKNINFGHENTFKETLEQEKYAQRFLGNSEDYQEGVTAFFEKRKPTFKGN